MSNVLLIDGENFLHKIEEVLKREHIVKGLAEAVDIDFTKLFSGALSGINLSNKVFYGAKLHFNPDTSKKSQELIKSQRKLINNLGKHGFEFVMAGHVRGQKVGNKVVFREKGVDVRIAVDLVSWACEKKIKTAILCSSDSDLQPAIKEARRRKVKVAHLGFEHQPNKGLTYTTDRTILLRDFEIVAACTRKESKS